jgi:hypothetical protein
MSATNGTRTGRPPYKNSKNGPTAPGDEIVGEWRRSQLVRMDSRFCAALERAFKRRKERRESAAGVSGMPLDRICPSRAKRVGEKNPEPVGSSLAR